MAKKERKYIKIRGASEHNLKCVSLDIPRDEFVVFTEMCIRDSSKDVKIYVIIMYTQKN